MVVCGFPGMGKSTYTKNLDMSNTIIKVYDSDSSLYSWLDRYDYSKGRHPDFPNNYMNHIKAVNTDNSLVFVSSHKEVRHALMDANIPYVIMYPDLDRCNKEAYITHRIYEREGIYDGLTSLMIKNWESWIKEIDEEEYGAKLKVIHTTYLEDLISDIIHTYNNYVMKQTSNNKD